MNQITKDDKINEFKEYLADLFSGCLIADEKEIGYQILGDYLEDEFQIHIFNLEDWKDEDYVFEILGKVDREIINNDPDLKGIAIHHWTEGDCETIPEVKKALKIVKEKGISLETKIYKTTQLGVSLKGISFNFIGSIRIPDTPPEFKHLQGQRITRQSCKTIDADDLNYTKNILDEEAA